MKKILCLAAVLLVFVSGCGKEEEQKPQKIEKGSPLTASMLISSADVKELTGYEPKVSEENIRSKSTIRFDSDPIGEDPVIVEVYSYNGARSVSEVYEDFSKKKENRPKSETVEGFESEAYIAYPSINLYRDGHMVVVTAGSGGEEFQNSLLKEAAVIVDQRLTEFLKKNPTNSDLLADK